jgi:hypothetical protein
MLVLVNAKSIPLAKLKFELHVQPRRRSLTSATTSLEVFLIPVSQSRISPLLKLYVTTILCA